MPIPTVHTGVAPAQKPIRSRPGIIHGFSSALASQGISTASSSKEQTSNKPVRHSDLTASPRLSGPISLGVISEATPSVSHLLTSHQELRHQTWDIIFSPVNRLKQFTSMPPGVEVFLDPASQELLWNKEPDHVEVEKIPTFANRGEETEASTPILIGTIASDQPTLSHLLKHHPEYGAKTWEIIFSAVNRHKPYAELRPGTQILLDPTTLELSFLLAPEEDHNLSQVPSSHNSPRETSDLQSLPAPDNGGFAKNLAASIKSYIGRSYQSINCYELVIHGLQDLGVQYGGNGGLKQQLVQLATQQGLPPNAYYNGEGLIEIAGDKLFDESFPTIKQAEQQAQAVMSKIEPLLLEGMLLSFSTPTQGHTGVISRKNGEWTYVNSGTIDHQVDGGRSAKRVGEETLSEEIHNWFKLAQSKGTSLKVSAGIFDTKKLASKARLALRTPSLAHNGAI